MYIFSTILGSTYNSEWTDTPVLCTMPYGGRITRLLPGQTKLVIHLKNKNKVRHRKRWSQVLYLSLYFIYNTLTLCWSHRTIYWFLIKRGFQIRFCCTMAQNLQTLHFMLHTTENNGTYCCVWIMDVFGLKGLGWERFPYTEIKHK